MNRKLLVGLTVASIAFAPLLSFAQVTTSSIGTTMDAETDQLMAFVDLAIAKFWPVVLGLILIVSVWLLGRAIYRVLA